MKTFFRLRLVLPLLAAFFLACPLVTSTAVVDKTVALAGQNKLVVRNQNGGVSLSTSTDSSVVSAHDRARHRLERDRVPESAARHHDLGDRYGRAGRRVRECASGRRLQLWR